MPDLIHFMSERRLSSDPGFFKAPSDTMLNSHPHSAQRLISSPSSAPVNLPLRWISRKKTTHAASCTRRTKPPTLKRSASILEGKTTHIENCTYTRRKTTDIKNCTYTRRKITHKKGWHLYSKEKPLTLRDLHLYSKENHPHHEICTYTRKKTTHTKRCLKENHPHQEICTYTRKKTIHTKRSLNENHPHQEICTYARRKTTHIKRSALKGKSPTSGDR